MAKIRRVIRRVEPAGRVYFEEQLWPINIALVVLGCVLVGVSLAYQPLWERPWYATAWPSLIGVPLFVAVSIFAFRCVDNRVFRRSLQLSIVLCAIAHVAMIVQMIETRILSGYTMGQTAKAESSERPPPKIIPEYHPTQLIPEEDRPRQDFQKPVATQTPEPTRQPEQIVRQPSEQDRSPAEPQPVPVPEQKLTTEPNVVNRQAPNEVVPRLAAQTSSLSRQPKPSEAQISQFADMPQPAPKPAAAAEARPSTAAATKQQVAPGTTRRAATEPTTTSESRTSQLARTSVEPSPAAETAAAAAMARAAAKPWTPQSPAVAVDASAQRQQTEFQAVAPATTPAAREATPGVAAARRTVEPKTAGSAEARPQAARRDASRMDQPAVTAAATTNRRAPGEQPKPATIAAASESRVSAASNASVAEVTPRASTVERSAAEVTAASSSPARTPEVSSIARGQPGPPLTRQVRRETGVATLLPQAEPGKLPRRASAADTAAASPIAIDRPAAASGAADAADSSAQAARVALSRGQSGTAGSGRSENVDSSVPGNTSPALVSSGAARRAEATQQSPTGDALSPSLAAKLARSRAGASLPQAALKAQPVETPTAPGGLQVAEATASSSAAVTQASADAKKDAVTASKGVGEVDIGPTQMVAEAGIGRAAGGGQPTLSFQSPSPQLARTNRSGGAPLMALAAAEVGEVAAPPGKDGGSVATPQASSMAMQRPAVSASSSPSGAQTAGPALASTPESAAPSIAADLSGSRGDEEARFEARDAAAGEPSVDDEKNKRRLMRAAAGASGAIGDTGAAPVAMPDSRLTKGPAGGAVTEARATEVARSGAGNEGAAGKMRVKNLVVEASAGGAAGSVSAVVADRRMAAAADSGPKVAATEAAGALGRRAAEIALVSGTTDVAEIPEVGPMSAVAQAELDHGVGAGSPLSLTRQGGDSLPIDIAAPTGPGGLGTDYTPDVGVNTRQARSDSPNVQLRSARFLRTEVGGLPAVSTAAIVATEAFSSRGARVRGELPAGGRGTPSPQTEETIERGLAFLARYQAPDGGWSLQGFPEGAQLASDTAATALAVIAFQGAGYNHREFQYKDVVRGGIDYLVKSQKENGDLFVPLDDASNRSVWLYSHSLAAIALCEAYGMTQDPALKAPAQKAIDFIVASQHQRGGWRYSPTSGSDTSVTGWMMMALKSGELAKLRVPPATNAKIVRWLDDAQQSPDEPHLYRYNPYAPDTAEQRHGRTASKTMTAVGLLMRLYSGWKRDHQAMIRGAQYLAEHLPANGTSREPQRDTYYWYYATQVMAHVGGSYWQAWNDKLHPLLVNSQAAEGPLAGSWDPQGAIPDRWGPHAGRLYVTAMNLLSLEVQYRKLPIYENTVKVSGE